MASEEAIRQQVGRLLAWEDAHVGFDTVIDGLPEALRGKKPDALPYTPWQLLEHLRRTQSDILDFCRNPDYRELEWPADYWPKEAEPPAPGAWDESVAQFRQDRTALQQLAVDPAD